MLVVEVYALVELNAGSTEVGVHLCVVDQEVCLKETVGILSRGRETVNGHEVHSLSDERWEPHHDLDRHAGESARDCRESVKKDFRNCDRRTDDCVHCHENVMKDPQKVHGGNLRKDMKASQPQLHMTRGHQIARNYQWQH